MKTVTFISKTGYKFYLNRTPEQMIQISDMLRSLGEMAFYNHITIDLSKENTNVLHDNGPEE